MKPISDHIDAAARETKIPAFIIMGPLRSRSYVNARWLAVKKARLDGHSLADIGNALGGRDHTTVLYACRKMGI